MIPRALWLPYEVSDLDAAVRFYTEHLGLSRVDGWERPGERGVVLRAAGAAYLELVSPPDPASPAGTAADRASPAGTAADPLSPADTARPAPLAFELADRAAVDAAYHRWRPADPLAPPHRYPRGHHGFEVGRASCRERVSCCV